MLVFSVFFIAVAGYSQAARDKVDLYLIPGMATDCRVFKYFEFDTSLVSPKEIRWDDWTGLEGLNDYAGVLAGQIDTTRSFALLGVSMGGMLAMEIGRLVNPGAIILISSARSPCEIPGRYKVGRMLPVYKWLNDSILNRVTAIKYTLRDIRSEEDKVLYQQMVKETGAEFFKWQMNAVVNWKMDCVDPDIPKLHIHGSSDNILPVRKIQADYIIQKGTHKMVINYSRQLSSMINDYLKQM